MQKSHGFTIVELLIVIVIIGILAALVIVAYNGVQQRASNTQRITAAKEWQKLITSYLAQNSQYPPAFSGSHICLGAGPGYPINWNADPDVDCYTTSAPKSPNPATNTAFQTLTPKLPLYPPDAIQVGSATAAGLSVRSLDTLDPTPGANKTNYPMLYYFLAGNNKDCALRPVVTAVSGGYAITSAVSSTAVYGNGTLCIIALPDPSNL